jgi:hypothetical protein
MGVEKARVRLDVSVPFLDKNVAGVMSRFENAAVAGVVASLCDVSVHAAFRCVNDVAKAGASPGVGATAATLDATCTRILGTVGTTSLAITGPSPSTEGTQRQCE